jgi:hypothetical protein
MYVGAVRALSAVAVRNRGPLSEHWLVGSRSDPTIAKAEADPPMAGHT